MHDKALQEMDKFKWMGVEHEAWREGEDRVENYHNVAAIHYLSKMTWHLAWPAAFFSTIFSSKWRKTWKFSLFDVPPDPLPLPLLCLCPTFVINVSSLLCNFDSLTYLAKARPWNATVKFRLESEYCDGIFQNLIWRPNQNGVWSQHVSVDCSSDPKALNIELMMSLNHNRWKKKIKASN